MQWSIEKKELNHDLYRISLFTFIPNPYLIWNLKKQEKQEIATHVNPLYQKGIYTAKKALL